MNSTIMTANDLTAADMLDHLLSETLCSLGAAETEAARSLDPEVEFDISLKLAAARKALDEALQLLAAAQSPQVLRLAA